MTEESSRTTIPNHRVWYRSGRIVRFLCVMAICVLLAGFWYFHVNSSIPPVPVQKSTPAVTEDGQRLRAEADRSLPKTAPRAPNSEGYVGPQACAACHAERVAEFEATRHFQACVETPVDGMPMGFLPGQGRFVPPGSNVEFLMTRSGTDFLQTAIDRSGQTEKRTSSRIDLVYGAGAGTDEVYFTWNGDHLSELPMCWLHPGKEWGVSGFDRDGSGDFSRPTTPRCMECHNTWMKHLPGTRNEYHRQESIYGITCEVCHGPGQAHARHHQSHPADLSANSIQHPGQFSRELKMDLCAQCHSNALKHRGPAFRYRPGQPLEAFYKTLKTKNPEDDHVANQVSYLRQSKCFQQSEDLTCITCHNPHQAKPAVERGSGGRDCLQCHQPLDCHERERLPEAVQHDCVGCHMPRGEKIQVSFATATTPYYAPVPRWEHRIAVYPMARDAILLAWYRTQSDADSVAQVARLTSSLYQYWLDQIEECAAANRFLASIHACRKALQYRDEPKIRQRMDDLLARYAQIESGRPRVRHLIEESRFDEAMELATEILKLNPDDAITTGNLGTLYAVRGDKERARQYWKMAAELDCDDPYGPSMLGWQAYLDGNDTEAIKHYLVAESIEPYFDKINYQLGLSLSRSGQRPEAIARFRRTVEINPRHFDGHLHLVQALRRSGEIQEAITAARHAARISLESNLSILTALAETFVEAGDFTSAERTGKKMLSLAQLRDPQQVPQIRKWVDEWHAAAQKKMQRSD